MEFAAQLSARHEQVLQATIRHYVATAEPVASRALTREYDLKVSPATVRNAMGWLEKSGLLYQPHTSAGRVPSDSGYRLYVDRLMAPSGAIGQKVDALLSEELSWVSWSLEALLKEATQILANISGYLALVTVPQTSAVLIRHIQLVEVDPKQILMIVLLDSLTTQSVVIQLPPFPEQNADASSGQELQILSNFLTHHLRGKPLADVAKLDWSNLDHAFQYYADMLCQALLDLAQRPPAMGTTQLVISGLSEVLRQPEFSESQQVQAIIRFLEEEQSQLWPLFFEAPPVIGDKTSLNSDVRVWIGSENPIEPMQGCALVVSNYTQQEIPLGTVGVLGPTRMVYENAVAIVKAAADNLSNALSRQ
jgi:heat-inducible transcriptional repressor